MENRFSRKIKTYSILRVPELLDIDGHRGLILLASHGEYAYAGGREE